MGVVLTPPPRIQELNRASRSLRPSRGTLRPREVQESAQGHTASQGQKCRRRSWGAGLGVGLCPRSCGAGGSLRTMAAGRGATPTPAKGRCSSCRSHRTGTQPETGPSEGALWPNRGGGAPALPGEGDRRGQSSQDRAGQTRGPWTRRCPKQLRGESPSYWKQLLGMCVFSPFRWSPDQSDSTCAPLCVCVSGACAAAGFRRSRATRAVVRPLLAASLLLGHPGDAVAALGQGRCLPAALLWAPLRAGLRHLDPVLPPLRMAC